MTTLLAASQKTDLHLVPIVDVSRTGEPILAGVAKNTLTIITPLPPSLTTGFAVCKAFGDDQIAVLGYLSHDAITAAQATETTPDTVTIRNGKSAIHLHSDGRVHIDGEDVKVTSHGRLALDGAYIELN